MADNQQQFWLFEVFGTSPDTIDFFGNAGIIIPRGTTLQRPSSPVEGHIRLNTDTNEFEGFFDGLWQSIAAGGGGGGTYIGLSDTPGTYVGQGNRVLRVNSAENGTEFSAVEITNSGAIDVSGVTNYESLVTNDDIVPNRRYVNDQDNLRLALTGGTMTGNIVFSSGTITGLPTTPTSSTEAASKAYVDSIAAGLDPKESCRLATTGDITLSGNQNIDGVLTTDGDRVLVKDQADPTENGIYIADSGAWSRAPDQDGTPANEVSGGNFTFVDAGTVNEGTGWVVVFDGILNLGVDDMNWTQVSSSGGSFLPLAGGTMTGDIVMSSSAQFLAEPTLGATTPGYAFDGDDNTGMFSTVGDILGFSTGGTSRWTINASGHLIPGTTLTYDIGNSGVKVRDIYADHFYPNFGAAGDPTYSFEGDTNTGMYNGGGDEIVFAVGGTDALTVESDGTVSVNTASYENLVTSDNDIPNKAYVDQTDTGAHFLLQPGGTADPDNGVFTDWASLYAVVSARSTLSVVEFDDSLSSPISIPAGSYDISDILFKATDDSTSFVDVSFADGADFGSGDGFESVGPIQWTNTGTAPVFSISSGVTRMHLSQSRFRATGTAPMIEMSSTGILTMTLRVEGGLVGTTFGSAVPPLDVTSTSNIVSIRMFDTTTISEDAISSVGGVASFQISLIGASMTYNTTQPNSTTVPTVSLFDDSLLMTYDPTFDPSTLVSTTVQEAIDELDSKITGGSMTIIDADGDTKVDVEESADEDIIRFDTGDSPAGYQAIENIMILSSAELTVDMGSATGASTVGGTINFTAGAGGTTAAGGAINLTGGQGGSTSGAGGNINLTGGNANGGGSGGTINILAGDGASSGGAVNITAGASTDPTLFGAQVVITGGAAAANGRGGTVQINGADGGATSGQGGNVEINGGDAPNGIGGQITLRAGNANGTGTFKGGNINLFAGDAQNGGGSAAEGGDISIQAGQGSDSGAGGRVDIEGGLGGSAGGAGGNVRIQGGSVNGAAGGAGGDVILKGADSAGANTGGAVTITAGQGGPTNGTGGAVTITAGGQATNGDGGDVSLNGGDSGTTLGNTAGNILISTGTTNAVEGGHEDGASITLQADSPTGSRSGGSINIYAGDGGEFENVGGDIHIRGGDGPQGTTAPRPNGGRIILEAGGSANGNSISWIEFRAGTGDGAPDAVTTRYFEADGNGTDWIGIKAPNSLTTTSTLTLPDGLPGSSNQPILVSTTGIMSYGPVIPATGVNTMVDADGDTQIQVEESADEDIIRFDVGATGGAAIPNIVTFSNSTIQIGDAVGAVAPIAGHSTTVQGGIGGQIGGAGGNLNLFGGDGIGDDGGGSVTISAGDQEGTVGAAGTITISTPNIDADVDSGAITISTGDKGATTNSGDGGAISITTGGGRATSGDGADITLNAGSAVGSGAGGEVNINAGAGASPGGSINLTAGTSTGTDVGGGITLTAATGGTGVGGDGGPIVVTAGSAGAASNGDGGDIELRPGALDGAGADGAVRVIGPTAGAGVILLEDDAGGEFVGFTAPSTVTSSYTLAMPAADAPGALTSDGAGNLSFSTTVGSAGAVTDADGDTLIQVEESADEDIIRFDVGDSPAGYPAVPNIMTLASSGWTVAMGTADVAGTAGAPINLTAGTGGSSSGAGGAVNITGGAAGTGNTGIGGAVTITGGAGNGFGSGGGASIVGGDGGSSGRGGAVNILGGAAGATAGQGGPILIRTGTSPTEESGRIDIETPDGGAGLDAGQILITAGNGGSGANGGEIQISAGSTPDTGTGGALSLQAGNAFGVGTAGDLTISGGTAGSGTAGTIDIIGGGGGVVAGAVNITGGGGSGIDGADVTITGGSPGSSSNGGNVTINGASGGITTGDGGDVNLNGGDAQGGGAGGDVNVTAGASTGTDVGGDINITAGTGGTGAGGNGGALVFTAGDAGAASGGNGGDIELRPGALDGGGTDGVVRVIGPSAGAGTIRLEDDGGGDFVALQAPSVVSASYTLIMPAADAAGALTSDGAGNLSFSLPASVSDADGDTLIQVEEAADDDTIRFDTGDSNAGYPAVPDILTLSSAGFNLSMGTADTAATTGAGVTIESGIGNTTGVGGTVEIFAGDGGSNAQGGNVDMGGGDAGGGDNQGGTVNLFGGGGTGAGAGGDIILDAGQAGATGVGGEIQLNGGLGGGAGTGGAVSITAGDGGASDGAGGAVVITAGSGGATNSDGGDIELRPGALAGTGTDGVVSIIGPTAGPGVLEIQDTAGGDFVRITAPAVISASYTLTLPDAVATVANAPLLSDTSGNLSFGTVAVGTVRKFSQNNTTTAASEQFTHSLDTTEVVVQVYDLTVTPKALFVPDSVEVDDADNVTVTLGVAPSATDEYQVVIMG